jgi:hypothetical protein
MRKLDIEMKEKKSSLSTTPFSYKSKTHN